MDNAGRDPDAMISQEEEPEAEAMPETRVFCRERGRHSICARCSEMKEVDNPESRRALDSTSIPPGD